MGMMTHLLPLLLHHLYQNHALQGMMSSLLQRQPWCPRNSIMLPRPSQPYQDAWSSFQFVHFPPCRGVTLAKRQAEQAELLQQAGKKKNLQIRTINTTLTQRTHRKLLQKQVHCPFSSLLQLFTCKSFTPWKVSSLCSPLSTQRGTRSVVIFQSLLMCKALTRTVFFSSLVCCLHRHPELPHDYPYWISGGLPSGP